jgi:ArsR family transcriptional regulator
MNKSARHPESLVARMEALADRTRLRLLRLLERHELGVAELCNILQLPQSTVSRHLKVLSDQSLARSRRHGTTHLYRTILDELNPSDRKLWLLAREQTADWPTVRQDELRLARCLRHRANGSQAFFAGAAGKWDKLRRELYGESFATAAMLALLPRDHVVADLGCGTGQLAEQLSQSVCRVIGIDNSAAMLRAARRRLADRDNVELLRAELSTVPLDDSTCDAALLLLVLTYIADIEPVLREAHRILKPEGRLVVVDLLPHDRDDFRQQMGQQHCGFELEPLQANVSKTGFQDAVCATLPTETDAKGPALFLLSAVRG